MKINEVEAAVGVTKKNIRFYEEEGLISPRREPGNGYRSYSEASAPSVSTKMSSSIWTKACGSLKTSTPPPATTTAP